MVVGDWPPWWLTALVARLAEVAGPHVGGLARRLAGSLEGTATTPPEPTKSACEKSFKYKGKVKNSFRRDFDACDNVYNKEAA